MQKGVLVPALKLSLASLAALVVFPPFFYAFLNVYRPRIPVRTNPKDDGLNFDAVSICTSDGQTLRGWFLFGRENAPLIVLCHGVGTNREDLRDVSRFLCRAGLNVLTFDFRGHGESTGHKTSFGLYEALDVRAAVAYAREVYSNRFNRIGIYALSMGSAAVLLASEHLPEVDAFIFDSPFARLSAVLAHQFCSLPNWLAAPFEWLTSFFGSVLMGGKIDAVAPECHVQNLGSRPVLIFHGSKDALIPVEQGKALFERITGPKEFIEAAGAGHGESHAFMGFAYEKKVVSFFVKNLGDGRP